MGIALAFASSDGGDLRLVVETSTACKIELSWAGLTSSSTNSTKLHHFGPLAAPRQVPLNFELRIDSDVLIFQVPALHKKSLRVAVLHDLRSSQSPVIDDLNKRSAQRFSPDLLIEFGPLGSVQMVIWPRLIRGEVGPHFRWMQANVLSKLQFLALQNHRQKPHSRMMNSQTVRLKAASFVLLGTEGPIVYPSPQWNLLEAAARASESEAAKFVFVSSKGADEIESFASRAWVDFRALMSEQAVNAVFINGETKDSGHELGSRFQRGFMEQVAYLVSSDERANSARFVNGFSESSSRYFASDFLNQIELSIDGEKIGVRVWALEGGLIDEFETGRTLGSIERLKTSASNWTSFLAVLWALLVLGIWLRLLIRGPFRKSRI